MADTSAFDASLPPSVPGRNFTTGMPRSWWCLALWPLLLVAFEQIDFMLSLLTMLSYAIKVSLFTIMISLLAGVFSLLLPARIKRLVLAVLSEWSCLPFSLLLVVTLWIMQASHWYVFLFLSLGLLPVAIVDFDDFFSKHVKRDFFVHALTSGVGFVNLITRYTLPWLMYRLTLLMRNLMMLVIQTYMISSVLTVNIMPLGCFREYFPSQLHYHSEELSAWISIFVFIGLILNLNYIYFSMRKIKI